ncbi:MAG: NfeD family protein, partial [Myxococcales bacterium]|nr:NfeD family protein [Myxococcales bacterium]
GFLPIFLSLRFWTFSLLAFGLSGSLLHFPGWANSTTTLVVALSLGLASGLGVSWVFRALARTQITSGGSARDAIGQVGKVLVPCSKGGRGKVRIELRGQTVDFLVTTDEEALAAGELVLVEDVDTSAGNSGGLLQVSRAPAEWLPPSSRPRTRVE